MALQNNYVFLFLLVSNGIFEMFHMTCCVMQMVKDI